MIEQQEPIPVREGQAGDVIGEAFNFRIDEDGDYVCDIRLNGLMLEDGTIRPGEKAVEVSTYPHGVELRARY